MKHLKALTILTLPFMWSAYFLFELLTKRITNISILIANIVLIIFLILIGYLFYGISLKYENGFSINTFLKIFLTLMVLDQGSKIIIKQLFFNDNATIINDILYFNPIINTEGSWINARFNTGISFTILIVINLLALFLFIEIYRYYLHSNNDAKSFHEDMCFLFIFSGALCSLIDKLFYGGSLDFIGIGNLFVADIKDIYINLGMLFFISSIYKNGYLSSNNDSSFSDDLTNIKKFIYFIKDDLCSLIDK